MFIRSSQESFGTSTVGMIQQTDCDVDHVFAVMDSVEYIGKTRGAEVSLYVWRPVKNRQGHQAKVFLSGGRSCLLEGGDGLGDSGQSRSRLVGMTKLDMGDTSEAGRVSRLGRLSKGEVELGSPGHWPVRRQLLATAWCLGPPCVNRITDKQVGAVLDEIWGVIQSTSHDIPREKTSVCLLYEYFAWSSTQR
ncbi:hypothetical protein LY76DRAFT_636846 [Colletotrichum caudatum]|nr:hypothetical protein LY76DRAFT_636846 [Colletotrichum caudatum]